MTRNDFDELKAIMVNAVHAAVEDAIRPLCANIELMLAEYKALRGRLEAVERRLDALEERLED